MACRHIPVLRPFQSQIKRNQTGQYTQYKQTTPGLAPPASFLLPLSESLGTKLNDGGESCYHRNKHRISTASSIFQQLYPLKEYNVQIRSFFQSSYTIQMPNPHISTQGRQFAGFFRLLQLLTVVRSSFQLPCFACCKQTCEFLLVFAAKKKVKAFLCNVDVYLPPKQCLGSFNLGYVLHVLTHKKLTVCEQQSELKP